MGEDTCKQYNWQAMTLQSLHTAYMVQYYKQPNQKIGRSK